MISGIIANSERNTIPSRDDVTNNTLIVNNHTIITCCGDTITNNHNTIPAVPQSHE